MRKPRTRIGEFNQRIAIWNTTLTSDSMGGTTESVPTVALMTVWARIEPMTGTRGLDYAQVTGFQGYTFTMNYRSDIAINYTNYIMYNSRKFQITSVLNPTEGDTELQILAYEKK
jgi:SPP1 family predicted phage head-tail adaptor